MGRTKLVADDYSSIVSGLNTLSASRQNAAGMLPVFGGGYFRAWHKSGTFSVPAGVTKIRVRVVGVGGSGGTTGTAGTAGGTVSFGALISATGGQGGVASDANGVAVGGIGVGGDFQADGAGVTKNGTINGYGGGAAGSQLGEGGTSTSTGGGAPGGNDATGRCGASAAGLGMDQTGGPDAAGRRLAVDGLFADMPECDLDLAKRFPGDFFTGRGAARVSIGGLHFAPAGGSGGGGAGQAVGNEATTGPGGDFAGGGGCLPAGLGGGDGGIGGGGGGEDGGGGGAGGGYAHGEYDVAPGAEYVITIPVPAARAGYAGRGGHGQVVVEW